MVETNKTFMPVVGEYKYLNIVSNSNEVINEVITILLP